MTRQRFIVAVAALAAVVAGGFGTFHSAGAVTGPATRYAFSTNPIAPAGSLTTTSGPVTFTLTAFLGTSVDASATVNLSFTDVGLAPSGAVGGTATATDTTTRALSITPSGFVTNTSGTISITYTPSPGPTNIPTSGHDAVTATDPSNGLTRGDNYSFSSLAQYVWSGGTTIAPSGTLAAGEVETFTVTAEGSGSAPVPSAPVYLSLTAATGGGSATATDAGGTTALTTAPTRYTADSSGTVSVTYRAPTSLPSSGTDTVLAQDHSGSTGISAATAYTFTSPPTPFHPTGVGQPAVTVGSDGTQLIFWQGAGNHLIEAWWNGSWNGPVDWTAANGWAATVTSAPSVVIQANGIQLIFWQGPGGHLFEAWYAGGWNGPVDWTAANHWPASVTSAPSVALAPDGTTQLIFWQGAGSHLMEAWWHGSWNGPVDWTAANHWAPSVASSPSVTYSGSTQVIFWKGTTGHLMEAWWSGSWNGPVDWTAAKGWGSPLTSAPTAVVQPGGIQLIFWQGANGHLIEVWWNGNWNGPVDWTAANGWGSPLTSAPSAVLQSNGTQLIFWQGAGGHLIEVWWNGHWNGPADWSA
jgi:hypothetical protein